MLACGAVRIVSVRDLSFHSGAMIQKGSGDEAFVQFSISRGLRRSWLLRRQISLDYYTRAIPPATQASTM